MTNRKTKNPQAAKRVHAGRVTLGPCSRRENGAVCEPLNFVQIVARSSDRTTTYAACTCGRRYAPKEHPDPWMPILDSSCVSEHPPPAADWDLRNMPDAVATKWSRPGVVPIGTKVLHECATEVLIDDDVRELGRRMIAVMNDANGIGLAANQVGIPARVFVHSFERVVPPIIINPRIVDSSGAWVYSEGCLSLQGDGVRATLTRPKIIDVQATLVTGDTLFVRADELVSRVFQHEIDHLDGLEYVQRLTGEERKRVYAIMEANGIDVRWVPPTPY